MAGRPLGLRSLVRALGQMSPAQVRKLIASASKGVAAGVDGKVAKLKAKREKHAKAIVKLDRQIAELSGGNGSTAAPARRGRRAGRRKGFKLSAATRNRMRIAALKRYGKKPEAAAAAATAEPRKKRKPFSAETRARMAAAQKARWEKVKGAAEAKSTSQ